MRRIYNINVLKTYNVDFGACNLLYPWCNDYKECLIVDAGSINHANKARVVNEVLNDALKYDKVNILISHFHKDHYSLFPYILNRLNKDTVDLYLYSPFGNRCEFKLQLFYLLYQASINKISKKEIYILRQFILTPSLRKMAISGKLNVKFLKDNDIFKINEQEYKVLPKFHSDNVLKRLEESLNIFFEELKRSDDNSLRTIKGIVSNYDDYFCSDASLCDSNNQERINGAFLKFLRSSSENFIQFSDYNVENLESTLIIDDKESELLTSEINTFSKVFKKFIHREDNKFNDLINFCNESFNSKSFTSYKTYFDKHRYNLAFYSVNHYLIYFGDNNIIDTKAGIKEISNHYSWFFLGYANHHGTTFYSPKKYDKEHYIHYAAMIFSNGVGNKRYGKADLKAYNNYYRRFILTNYDAISDYNFVTYKYKILDLNFLNKIHYYWHHYHYYDFCWFY